MPRRNWYALKIGPCLGAWFGLVVVLILIHSRGPDGRPVRRSAAILSR